MKMPLHSKERRQAQVIDKMAKRPTHADVVAHITCFFSLINSSHLCSRANLLLFLQRKTNSTTLFFLLVNSNLPISTNFNPLSPLHEL